MISRAVFPLFVVLALIVPTAASADEERDANGAVSAVMSYTPGPPDTPEWRDVRVAVTRAGAAAVDEALAVRGCEVPYCRPVGVTVRDLDSDGEPEVLVDVFTGGAHCCTLTQLFTWNGTGYDRRTHGWADAGYTLEDLDRDGRPELRSADARFAYAFASYAGSAMPLQVWQVDGGRFEDVTAGFPDLVRRDAARWLRIWRGRRGKRDMEPNGTLAAWVADMHVLGKAKTAGAQLRVALRRKWVTRGFVRDLNTFLKANGYRR